MSLILKPVNGQEKRFQGRTQLQRFDGKAVNKKLTIQKYLFRLN
jgi:hypothetical protein